MRFNVFHNMPYGELPDDFDEKYDTASLVFPNRYYDPQKGAKYYERYLDELEYCERLGYDSVCINEHHQSAYGLMPSPNIIAAALARRTHKIQIAVMGNAIALRDHPLRVAEEIAMLDAITNGRIISGFVRGIGYEYYAQSLNPTKSLSRFREAHDLIVKAWTTREPFEWVGDNYEFRYVNVWPRCVQEPHPRIWVPGTGSRETMEWVAKHRYDYFTVYAPRRVLHSWFGTFRDACAREGYEPEPENIGLSVPIYVAETDEQAEAEARPHLEWLYSKGLRIRPKHYFPAGYMSEGSWRGLLSNNSKQLHELSFEELLDLEYAFIGSPKTVIERLGDFLGDLGVGNINAVLHFGDMPHYKTIKNLEMFANHVMPVLKAQAGAAKRPMAAE